MPRNMSAWVDLTIQLIVMLVFIGLLTAYSRILAGTAFVVWVCLALFAKERCHVRTKRFERYCRSVVQNISEMGISSLRVSMSSITLSWASTPRTSG